MACSKHIVPGGKVSRVRYTDIYVWDGAAWRLVSAQNTPIKDDVPTAARIGVTPAHAPGPAGTRPATTSKYCGS